MNTRDVTFLVLLLLILAASWYWVTGIGDRIQFAILLGLFWYANETYKSRLEAKKENDVEIAPFLVMGWDPANERLTQDLYVKNMGSGIATNVVIKRKPSEITAMNLKIKYEFVSITAIMPRDNAGVSVRYKENNWMPIESGGEIAIDIRAFNQEKNNIDPTKSNYIFHLTYEDILGRRYETTLEASRDHNDSYKVIDYKAPFAAVQFGKK